MGLSADVRAATVAFLTDYAASVSPTIKLQVYPGRPRSIQPPTAFVDRMADTITYLGPVTFQRRPLTDVIILHGLFDSKDAVDQRDDLVDGLLEYVTTRFHDAGDNALIAVTELEDIDTFVNDWMPPEQQRSYFATRIRLEGFGTN